MEISSFGPDAPESWPSSQGTGAKKLDCREPEDVVYTV